jgi:hypothetical protein
MHTLHWICIEAESPESAAAQIKDNLNTNEEGYRLANWSDWHVVGGGRWNPDSEGIKSADNPSDCCYKDRTNMVVSYKDNPDEFITVLSDIKQYRIKYMNEKLLKLDNAVDKLKSDIVDYISNDCKLNNDREFDFSRWEIKGAITMLSSEWTPDSLFFDNQEFTSKLQYLEERLDKPEEAMRQYLVPVDFHF